MLTTPNTLRAATREDAPHLAELVNFAGEGLPLHYWHSLAEPGTDPWTIGTERARRDHGAFSYRNTMLAECDGRIAGSLITYPITETASADDLAQMPPAFVPIQALEDLAIGTHYVSVLALYPAFRGRGIGSRLLQQAEQQSNGAMMSIVVSDGNEGAKRLYERFGFRVEASRTMVKGGWQADQGNRVKNELTAKTPDFLFLRARITDLGSMPVLEMHPLRVIFDCFHRKHSNIAPEIRSPDYPGRLMPKTGC